jgi:hypothetical protein
LDDFGMVKITKGANSSLRTISGASMLHYLVQQPLYQNNRPDVEEFLLKQNKHEKNEPNKASNTIRRKYLSFKNAISSLVADDNQTKLLELILENGG